MLRLVTPRSRGGRGVVAIMLGTALGQVLALLASPFLSRLYSPSDFGIFASINALAMVLGTVMALRYELAIPLPREEADARHLVVLGGLVTTWTTLVGIALAAAFHDRLASVFGVPQLGSWLIWVPLIAGAVTFFQILNQWALRQHRYTATARRNVVQSVATMVTQLLAGWRSSGPGGLVLGLAGGQILGAASLTRGASLRGHVARGTLIRLARRFRRFPLLLAPSGLLNAVGLYLPVLLFGALYGTQVAGWFGFTQRILALPIALVGQAIAQVYLSELAAAKRHDTDRERQLFRLASTRLVILGVVGALLLLLLARPLFPLVFGAPWRESGAMAQALAISLALQFLANPLSQTLIVYEQTALQLGWDTARLIAVTTAIVVPAQLGASPLAAVWCMSVASAVCYAASWWLSLSAVRRAT